MRQEGYGRMVALNIRLQVNTLNPLGLKSIQKNTSDLVHALGHLDGELTGSNTEEYAVEYARTNYDSLIN